MGFTVNHTTGLNNDAEFEAYARLLRQQGVDLGNLPRAPEPGTGRRWLYVWDTKEKAQAFAEELKNRTHSGWAVVEVAAPPSEGPLGPLIVQVGRRANGLVLELHSLSRALLRSAYPDRAAGTTMAITFDTFQEFQTRYGSIESLARKAMPALTGLEPSELDRLGYALIEDDSDRTLAFVRPGDLVQA